MSDSPNLGVINDEKLRELDSQYKSFPPFSEWLAKTEIDTTRWNRYTALLKERKTASPELLKEAQEIVKRAAAIDTGAIENLYDLPQGFTITVAMQNSFLQTIGEEKGEKVRNLVESQVEAYDYVLDLATQRTPVSDVAIRELHEVICREQETYLAKTPVGLQNLPLPKGKYKASPNHVIGRDGNYHAFAPVDLAPGEMFHLISELRSEAFENAHPVLQASYAHYAFILIHPFSDGNGRVARALASVFTYRSQSVPLLILMENKPDYLDALSSADNGEFQPFVNFVLERTLDSIQLIDDSLRAASAQSLGESLLKIRSLSKTKGGYSHTDVDKGANDLLNSFGVEFKEQIGSRLKDFQENLTHKSGFSNNNFGVNKVGYRSIVNSPSSFQVTISTKILPQNFSISRVFSTLLPIDSGIGDDIILWETSKGFNPIIEARASQVIPRVTSITQMRIATLIEPIISEMLAELEQKARQSLGR